VYYVTVDGQTAWLPASWTDARPPDPFVEKARGRALARVADLLELAVLIQNIAARDVKENKPDM
jgi:hypothetical protein